MLHVVTNESGDGDADHSYLIVNKVLLSLELVLGTHFEGFFSGRTFGWSFVVQIY